MIKQRFQEIMNTNEVFVGDICYALSEDIYDNVWGEEMGYQDGVIKKDAEVCAVVAGTYYGDGLYYGRTQRNGFYYRESRYAVDAGVLGVTNMKFNDEKVTAHKNDCGTHVSIPSGRAVVKMTVTDKGTFNIKVFDGNMKGELLFSQSIRTNC